MAAHELDVVLLGQDPTEHVELGGKGRALDRLVRSRVPVPPTAVVAASVYQSVAHSAAVADVLARIRRASDPPDPAEVDAVFAGAPIAGAHADAILEAARRLGPRVAVRSSATAEDLSGQSFAGQYRSLLDVHTGDADELLAAVRAVWASLWHPAPWAYRRAWAVPEDDLAMAVVLMRMIPARTAGVAFSTDPTGTTARMRIEAVDGLGERLVSGDATPSVWLLERREQDPLPPDAPPYLHDVRAAVLAVEETEGSALDIEWARDDTTTWVVQSRPITVGPRRADGFDTTIDDHELTTAGIDEMLPGVLPPLRWETNSFLVEEALRRTLDVLGGLTADHLDDHRFIRRVRGRAAMDLDLLKVAAESIQGGSAAEIERAYFGVAAHDDAPAPVGRLRGLAQDLRSASARRRSRIESAILIEASEQVTAGAPDLAAMTDRGALAYRTRLLDLGVRAVTAELAVAATAGADFARLEQVLELDLDATDAAAWAQRVTRGAGLPPRPHPSASMSVFGGPRWDEVGIDPPELRRAADDDELAADRDELAALLRSDRARRRRRALTGQVVDVRMHLLHRLIDDAIHDLGTRESTKAAVLRLGGEVRRVHLELGRRLVDRDRLDRAEDVELLGVRELRRTLDGEPLAPALVARRRRWNERWAEEDPLPVRFTGVPESRAADVASGDQIAGRAASPGVHRGRAVVVRQPTDPFPAGAVLVAAATDAGWSPLFLRAGAVVVERGGPLSHAAIVARELGLPAVLDVSQATRVLGDETITVDGDRGLVTIHRVVPA